MATMEELQSEIESLRRELRKLTEQASPAPVARERGALSRRNLLRVAPVVAVGGAIAALSVSPASAATGDSLVLGKNNHADTTTELDSALTLDGPVTANAGITAESLTIPGVNMNSGGTPGVDIQSPEGGTSLVVRGSYIDEDPSSGPALVVTAAGAVAVTAFAEDTPVRFSTATAYGNAVKATSTGGTAVVVSSTSGTTPNDAVTIDYEGTSRALYAHSHNPTNINGTVTGVNQGHGIGVWGEQRNDTGTGFGLVGVGGALGRGARLSGGAAAFQILPSSAATHPTTGKVGDVFLDSSARLWLCQKASSGSVVATWKQLA